MERTDGERGQAEGKGRMERWVGGGGINRWGRGGRWGGDMG